MVSMLTSLVLAASSTKFLFQFDIGQASRRKIYSVVVLEVERAGCATSNGVYAAQPSGGEAALFSSDFRIHSTTEGVWVIAKGHSPWYTAKHADLSRAYPLPPHSPWVSEVCLGLLLTLNETPVLVGDKWQPGPAAAFGKGSAIL
jgi:hypothetical protein